MIGMPQIDAPEYARTADNAFEAMATSGGWTRCHTLTAVVASASLAFTIGGYTVQPDAPPTWMHHHAQQLSAPISAIEIEQQMRKAAGEMGVDFDDLVAKATENLAELGVLDGPRYSSAAPPLDEEHLKAWVEDDNPHLS